MANLFGKYYYVDTNCTLLFYKSLRYGVQTPNKNDIISPEQTPKHVIFRVKCRGQVIIRNEVDKVLVSNKDHCWRIGTTIPLMHFHSKKNQ
jgi:hypothetical protein